MGGNQIQDAWDECDRLRAERDRYRAALEQAQPIVDAACEWRDGMAGDGWTDYDWAVARAVDEYRAMNGGTDD